MTYSVARLRGDFSGPRSVGNRREAEIRLTFAGSQVYNTGGIPLNDDTIRTRIADLVDLTWLASVDCLRITGAAAGSQTFWDVTNQKLQILAAGGAELADATVIDTYVLDLRIQSTGQSG